ncbi:hypothetical protein FKP32DRAFT_1054198 [Trametes sanguinea]|nr:hypothetical protein FKP32DRAFT_1054198 [Trametes sanguinea]
MTSDDACIVYPNCGTASHLRKPVAQTLEGPCSTCLLAGDDSGPIACGTSEDHVFSSDSYIASSNRLKAYFGTLPSRGRDARTTRALWRPTAPTSNRALPDISTRRRRPTGTLGTLVPQCSTSSLSPIGWIGWFSRAFYDKVSGGRLPGIITHGCYSSNIALQHCAHLTKIHCTGKLTPITARDRVHSGR